MVETNNYERPMCRVLWSVSTPAGIYLVADYRVVTLVGARSGTLLLDTLVAVGTETL